MTKRINIRKSFLFGLVLIDEVLKELHDPGGFISYSYENLYGFVPSSYKRKSLYSFINSLKSQEKVKIFKKGKFSITDKGRNEVYNFFPLMRFLKEKWDGKWRILGFDIEEERRGLRNKLRKQISCFGFRMLQESLYISPLNVENYIKRLLLLSDEFRLNTYLFVSDKFFLENEKEFIDKIFKITEVNLAYQDFLGKIDSFKDRDLLLRSFLAVSAKDPFLPKELLPEDFVRDRVWENLRRKNILVGV